MRPKTGYPKKSGEAGFGGLNRESPKSQEGREHNARQVQAKRNTDQTAFECVDIRGGEEWNKAGNEVQKEKKI